MLRRLTRALICAALCLPLPASAEVVGVTRLTFSAPPNLGGLSGLELSADGLEAHMLSDRGFLFRAAITRDETGRVTEIDVSETQRLRHEGEHNHPDSEGLALGANGQIYVSSEDPTRLLLYRWGNKDPQYAPDLPTTRPLDDNSGLEALALTPDGAVLTLFETSDDGVFQTYLFDKGAWRTGPALPASDGFAAVGADFDARGRLYLLERTFSLLGFRTRIRRFSWPDVAQGGEVIWTTRLGLYDNLEGIAVTETPQGMTRISLVSDDNYFSILRQEWVELLLDE